MTTSTGSTSRRKSGLCLIYKSHGISLEPSQMLAGSTNCPPREVSGPTRSSPKPSGVKMVSGRSSALQISSMISTSHIHAFAQSPRTTRTSSTDAVPRKSAFSNTPSASALSARVQSALEALKRHFEVQNEITGVAGVSSARNFAQNSRVTRIGSMGALSSESAFFTTPSASALSARAQSALDRLSTNQIAPFDTSGVILHSIGYGRGIIPSQFVCCLLVFALSRGKSTKSVCLARRNEATRRTDNR